MSRWRPGPGQQAFDFSRGEQLAILREVVIVVCLASDGGSVSATVQKAVLRVLDDHSAPGRPCWLSCETIAKEAGVGVRTVKRATKVLRETGLISVERRKARGGGVVNHYWIEWTELARRRPGRRPVSRHIGESAAEPPTRAGVDQGADGVDQGAVYPAEQSASPVDQSATTTDQSATMARAKCHGGTRTAYGTVKETPPPPTSSLNSKKEEEEEGICARKREAVDRLAASLRDLGIGTARATAEQLLGRVGTIEAAMAAIAEARATVALPINRARLKSVQGAIAWYLGNGVWPTRLISPAAQRAAEEAAKVYDASKLTAEQIAEATRIRREVEARKREPRMNTDKHG